MLSSTAIAFAISFLSMICPAFGKPHDYDWPLAIYRLSNGDKQYTERRAWPKFGKFEIQKYEVTFTKKCQGIYEDSRESIRMS
jgi:hypothetical protein